MRLIIFPSIEDTVSVLLHLFFCFFMFLDQYPLGLVYLHI